LVLFIGLYPKHQTWVEMTPVACLSIPVSILILSLIWEASQCSQVQWPMGVKANSRCRLDMLKVHKLRHSSLNVTKLENYGPTGECLNNNH